jgi:hypothetical protein
MLCNKVMVQCVTSFDHNGVIGRRRPLHVR